MKEVVFLIPTQLTRGYFLTLYQHCEQSIYARFDRELRPILRGVPRETQEFDPAAVLEVLDRELEQSSAIGYLIVAPTHSQILAQGVASFSQKRSIPVIALSLPFPDPEDFTSLGLNVPPVVATDNEGPARELGLAAVEECRRRQRNLTRIKALLVPGEIGRSDSDSRLKGFEAGLRHGGLEVECISTAAAEWKRDLAHSRINEEIARSPDPIDVIFCANDEMSIGARMAVRHGDARVQNCLIYGFDAIDEVNRLMLDHDPHMKGTVRQDLEEMAISLAELLRKMHSHRVPAIGPQKLVRAHPIIAPPSQVNHEGQVHHGEAAVDSLSTPAGQHHETLTQHAIKAWNEYLYAEAKLLDEDPDKKKVTDAESYRYLEKDDFIKWDLPPFHSWSRYVRDARHYYGVSKNSPRANRTGRSFTDSAGAEKPDQAE